MVKYGVTWWGGQWLNALSDIDFSNRIPRGRSYANKGAVKELSIRRNTIRANVQGTRRTPYQVTLKVPAFSAGEKKTLLQEIMDNPLLLSRLLNRELPRNLHEIANSHHIRIFPGRWDDLDMHCSCPDWAVPCKHLAAVINVMADAIDRNPFLIFKLHTFDIIDELKKRGMAHIEERVTIPDLISLVGRGAAAESSESTTDSSEPSDGGNASSGESRKPGAGSNLTSAESGASSAERRAAPGETMTTPAALAEPGSFDLASVPGMRENLLKLLNEKPVFYRADFKNILDAMYRKTARYASRKLVGRYGEEAEDGIFYEKYDRAEVHLRECLFFSRCILGSGDDTEEVQSVESLMDFLLGIPPRYINRLQDPLLVLYFAFHFSLRLAVQSAAVPQLVRLPGGSYGVRWIPALNNQVVKALHDSLANACPAGLVQGEQGMSLNPGEQVNALVSLFYRQIIRDSGAADRLKQEPVPLLFTEPFYYRFEGPGEEEIPGSIQRWIDPFFLRQAEFSPGFRITPDEREDTFRLEVFVENRGVALEQAVGLEEFLNDPEHSRAGYEVLRRLELLTGAYPGLEHIIATSGRYVPSYGPQEFAEIMFAILPLIRLYGITVSLPDELKHLVRPRLSMTLQHTDRSERKSFISLDKLLDFQYEVAIGDQIIGREEFARLVRGVSGIVKMKEQYVYVNPSDLNTLMDRLRSEEKLNRHELLQAAITGEYQGAKIRIDEKTRELIDSLMRVERIDLPAGLQADLRPYQRRGYDWLCKNAQLGFGSIIADDMGLGKTLQVISLLLRLKEEDPGSDRQALIVVPTTLITNWMKEFEKFAPGITCSVYHGPGREPNRETDVVLTSYGMVRSDQEYLSGITWRAVVIDEAQNIKNPSTAQTRAVKKLKSGIRVAMSGTPVENRLSEYWSIFDFTNRGYLGSRKKFADEFAFPIELSRDRQKLDRFLKITGPFIMRREKSDRSVISDLPDKVENDVFAAMVKEQAAIYENVLRSMMGTIEEVPVEAKEGKIQRKGLVLKMITALKQVCNHPSHYLKKSDYSPELSGKAGVFTRLMENILENNDKVLVFTQYREMGFILQEMIRARFDAGSLFLHGGTPRKQRDAMVEQFQRDPHRRIFILSLKAGGTGLNLTAANHVIHYDLWWNPAVEAQATDRAYRIGQDRNVMVHRMITRGTFEERINEMLKDKKQLADLSVTRGEKWIGELSNSELRSLFAYGVNA